jgi:hypothetical protein
MFPSDFKPLPPGLTPKFPDKCCTCLGSSETVFWHLTNSSYRHGTSRVATTTKYPLPICRSCERRLLTWRKKVGVTTGFAVLVAGGIAIAGIPLNRPILFLVAMGVVVLITIAFVIVAKRSAPASDTSPLRFRNNAYQKLYEQANGIFNAESVSSQNKSPSR